MSPRRWAEPNGWPLKAKAGEATASVLPSRCCSGVLRQAQRRSSSRSHDAAGDSKTKRARSRLNSALTRSLAESEPLRIQLDDPDEDLDDDIDDLEGAEVEELEEQLVDQATSARTLAELQHEIATLERLEALADQVRKSQVDKKWTELLGLLAEAPEMVESGGSRRKLIVFTEHRDTLNYLVDKLRDLSRQVQKLSSPSTVESPAKSAGSFKNGSPRTRTA